VRSGFFFIELNPGKASGLVDKNVPHRMGLKKQQEPELQG